MSVSLVVFGLGLSATSGWLPHQHGWSTQHQTSTNFSRDAQQRDHATERHGLAEYALAEERIQKYKVCTVVD